MRKQSAFQKKIIILMFVLLIGVLMYSRLQFKISTVNGENIRFSKESGFYNESVLVKLQAADNLQIYYTLDGSVPAADNAQAYLYEKGGIALEVAEGEYACTIKAGAFQDGVLVSDIESKTYIMGQNVKNRYSMPVLCVSGSPEEFYNEEDGIMTFGEYEGKKIEEDLELKEWAGIKQLGNRYQRGRENEKEVFITLFDKDGNQLLAQNGGFRLYGAYSRMKNQPSFRLYARSEYDEVNDFDYPFFADQYTAENTVQSEYKRVIVRNSGDDNGYGFIRSELATRIAKQAGFQDAPSASPVCVYLNGEYYGVHWFVTNFDDNYFQETYGEYTGEMYVYEGTVNQLMISEQEEDIVYKQLAEQYNEAMQYLCYADFTKEENWQMLNSLIDVESFLKYVALQFYVSNDDSMINNYRVYRYYAADGKYVQNTVFDGRYHIILFDMDHALGLVPDYSYILPEEYTLLNDCMNGELESERLIANLLQREECRQAYIRHTLSFMNYYFSEQYVKTELDKMHGSRNTELTHMILNTDLLKNNFVASDIADMDFIAHQMFLIERFAQLRPEFAKQDLELAFGEMTPYVLELDNRQQAYITLDYASLSEAAFTGAYYAEVPVQVSVQPRVGYEFDYWLVNGEKIEEESFAVEASMITEGQVAITCICSPAPNADLCISGVKAKNGDFIEITNIGTESRDLSEYCLTDNSSDKKSTLPAKLIKPGETVTVYCKGYSEVEALGQPVTNFNIKAGETVSLYRTGGSTVDSVAVPQLGSDAGVWRLDFATGEYREEI